MIQKRPVLFRRNPGAPRADRMDGLVFEIYTDTDMRTLEYP